MMSVSIPHGGRLINRLLNEGQRKEAVEKAKSLPRLKVGYDVLADVYNIAVGTFSPLEGFLNKDDFYSVLDKKRLTSGLVWTLPITLAIGPDESEFVREGRDVVLADSSGNTVAILHIESKYRHDKEKRAKCVYGTKDIKHPGVRNVFNMGDILLGGRIDLIQKPHIAHSHLALEPAKTRQIFHNYGWRSVTGFHTRNFPHRAHEYLQRCALEMTDGLLIHPIIGWKKDGDIPADVLIDSYKALIDNYYPKDRIVFSLYMRSSEYAGPREAVFHAIVRKNYGCTHFIVGRDHAGTGKYYDKYASHSIFDEFDDLSIIPLLFKEPHLCRRCGIIVTDKTCGHTQGDKLYISATMLRDIMKNKSNHHTLSDEIIRPEVADVVMGYYAKAGHRLSSTVMG